MDTDRDIIEEVLNQDFKTREDIINVLNSINNRLMEILKKINYEKDINYLRFNDMFRLVEDKLNEINESIKAKK